MLRRQEGHATSAVGKLCLPVACIPLATGLGTQSRLIGLALLGLLAVCAFLQAENAAEPSEIDRLAPAILLGALLLLVWSRGPRPVTASVIALAISFTLLGSLRRRARRDVISSVVDGLGLYLIASVLLHFVGMQSPSESLRFGGLETTIGLFGHRILFPLATSYATAPALAAGYLAGVPALMFIRGGWRARLRPVAIPAALFVLLAADYRAPLLYAVLVGAAVIGAPTLLGKRAPALAIIMLLLPFWYSHAVSVVTAVESRVSVLHRGEQSGGALSSRDLIWSRTLSQYYQFSTIKKLVGFGTDGHVTSGASGSYAKVTRSFLDPSIAAQTPPHSTALQELLDGGIIGICLYLAVMTLTFRRLASEFLVASEPTLLAAIAMLLVFTATAGTEVASAFSRAPAEPGWLLAVLVLIVSTSNAPRDVTPPIRSTRQ
jgi:O-antigen ligase